MYVCTHSYNINIYIHIWLYRYKVTDSEILKESDIVIAKCCKYKGVILHLTIFYEKPTRSC